MISLRKPSFVPENSRDEKDCVRRSQGGAVCTEEAAEVSSENRLSVQTTERAPVTSPCDSIMLRDISCCSFKQSFLIISFSERERLVCLVEHD